jgi:hypothetical protein
MRIDLAGIVIVAVIASFNSGPALRMRHGTPKPPPVQYLPLNTFEYLALKCVPGIQSASKGVNIGSIASVIFLRPYCQPLFWLVCGE